jgi:uncharacterized BrkB/YihY/UPF0761 family membrane protein
MKPTAALRTGLHELVGLYWDSGVSNDVPALAWFMLSALVPLALGLTALATVLLGDYATAQALADRVAGVLPKDVHDQVVQLIVRVKRDSPLLLAVSIAGMIWMSSGVVGVLERVLLRLLGRRARGVVYGKLRNLGVSAVLMTVIVVMVIVGSAGTGVVQRLELDPLLTRIVAPLTALTLIVALCTVVYRALSGEGLRWRAAAGGGAISGVILLATPTAAGYYLRYVGGRTPVELFLMLAGVLATCYVAAFGLLLGAGVTARIQLGHRLRAVAAAA